MVRARLRSLEKRLVTERAESQVGVLVNTLVLRWDMAVLEGKPTPDPIEFIRELIFAGFYLRTNSAAIQYLEKCRHDRKVPDERRLVQILLPWCR